MHLEVHRGAPRQWGAASPARQGCAIGGTTARWGRMPPEGVSRGTRRAGGAARPEDCGGTTKWGGLAPSPTRRWDVRCRRFAATPPGRCSVRNPVRTVFLRYEKNRIPSGGGSREAAAAGRGKAPQSGKGKGLPFPFRRKP